MIGAANSAISCAAIEHASELVDLVPPEHIRACLYLYGRRPCTPYWVRRFPDQKRVLDRLRASLDALVRRGWVAGKLPVTNDRWHLYVRPDAGGGRDDLPVKLYVNVGGDDMLASFDALAELFDAEGAPAFKVASDPPGLLRPDKLVVYLPSFEAAFQLALRVHEVLGPVDVQPLPFTGAVDGQGLVSLGFDPPLSVVSAFAEPSWRGFVCAVASTALIDAARRGLTGSQRVADALRQVESLGIDAQRWAPRVLT